MPTNPGKPKGKFQSHLHARLRWYCFICSRAILVTPAKRNTNPKDAPPPLSIKKGGDDDMELVEEPGLTAVDEEDEEEKSSAEEERTEKEVQDASYALSEGFEPTVEEPAESCMSVPLFSIITHIPTSCSGIGQ
jgi:hypothetical protein